MDERVAALNAAAWLRATLGGSEEALRDDALPPSARGEAAALAVLVARMLVARRFAAPWDQRIRPFARELVAVPPLDEHFMALEVHGVVQVLLGDADQLGRLRPERVVPICLLVTHALLAEEDYRPSQVDELIGYAESQVPALPDPNEPTSGNRPRRRRVPASIGRVVIAGAVAALLAGYLVAGFLSPGFLTGSTASQSPSYPPDVEGYVTELAYSIETKDGGTFQALLCTTAEPVETYIQQLGDVRSVVIDTVTGDGDYYTVLLEITGDDDTTPAAWLGHLQREEDQWCLKDFADLDQPSP